LRGKIKFFNEKKNFGFISTDNLSDDLYFNGSKYPKIYIPHKNQLVEFRVIETPRGKEAEDIHVLRYDE
jgi:cold shock CspA family protein